LGRQVKKGEKGIAILAPLLRKETDSETGRIDSKLCGFRVVYVYDLSQTEGEPFFPAGPLLTATHSDLLYAFKEIAKDQHVRVQEADMVASGVVSPDNGETTLTLKKGESIDEWVSTMAHELAHLQLKHLDPESEASRYARAVQEVEAESVAFVVCRLLGLDSASTSLPYIAQWVDGDPSVYATIMQKGSENRVNDAAHSLVALVEARLRDDRRT